MTRLAAVDPIQQWIDALIETAPAPTPEQSDLLRRVFRTRHQPTDEAAASANAA